MADADAEDSQPPEDVAPLDAAAESDSAVAQEGHAPTEELEAEGVAAVTTADGDDSSPLPEGWTSQASRSTGDVYFVNELTMETTYDRPTVPAAEWTDLPVEAEAKQEQQEDAAAEPTPEPEPEAEAEPEPEPEPDEEEVDDEHEVAPVPVTGRAEPEDWVELDDSELARARSSEAADELSASGSQTAPPAAVSAAPTAAEVMPEPLLALVPAPTASQAVVQSAARAITPRSDGATLENTHTHAQPDYDALANDENSAYHASIVNAPAPILGATEGKGGQPSPVMATVRGAALQHVAILLQRFCSDPSASD
jgi:hypothetical protein